MSSDAVRLLRQLANDVGPGLDVAAATRTAGVLLPSVHLELLQQMNGMTVFGGAFRLFGVRTEPFLDLRGWNAPETWRFA